MKSVIVDIMMVVNHPAFVRNVFRTIISMDKSVYREQFPYQIVINTRLLERPVRFVFKTTNYQVMDLSALIPSIIVRITLK